MARHAPEVTLSDDQRQALLSLTARRTTAQALAKRARNVLACATGAQNIQVAHDLGINQATIGKWRRRFIERGLEGLHDDPKPGAPRTITDEMVEAVIIHTLESIPRNATHWSSRMMAKESGISTSSVQRIWRAFGLQPHRTETFKLSTDPLFIDKVRDVVGLYLNPPEHALVLCVDEKSRVQALDRSQPVLPLRPGQVERRTHDYVRHGTTSLFADLNAATGAVIGRCYKRHRAVEFKKFLGEIERRVPDGLDFHIIMDNDATHKSPAIRGWFAKRPRWRVHFTPPGPSWLNMVERFFAEITERQIKRGVHRSERELKQAILTYIETRNENPKPFNWVRSADDIQEAVCRFCLQTSPDYSGAYL